MNKMTVKYLYLVFGWTMLLLGAIGVLLPLLPTTPFIILAAYCFNKGSPKIHQMLLDNKYFGGMIKDWEQSKVIRLKAKIYSTSMIIPLFAYTLAYVDVHISLKFIITAIGISVLTFIWTRASSTSESEISYKIA
jgi:uncharacterized protein